MSYRETTAPASTAAAADAVSKIKEAAAAEASNVSTTAAPISRWLWWATLLIALALLGALVLFQALLWSYVSATEESTEGEDFDQLKAIADNIQGVVMLLVGAIFGVGATRAGPDGGGRRANPSPVALTCVKTPAIGLPSILRHVPWLAYQYALDAARLWR